jgi:hypothetical protein
MKNVRTSPKSTSKDSDIKQAVGGQPENDQDAREAGLSSATSANGQEKVRHGVQRPSRAATKADKGR